MGQSIQAGQLGHYTWIIDEIMIEEVGLKTEASGYIEPFADAENSFGIQNETLASVGINDLVTLIGNFFGSSFVPVKDIPIQAKAQKGKITNSYIKKILTDSDTLYQILNVHTPEVEQPDLF